MEESEILPIAVPDARHAEQRKKLSILQEELDGANISQKRPPSSKGCNLTTAYHRKCFDSLVWELQPV